MEKLDKKVVAVCPCGADRKETTFRKLKNRWPTCGCRGKEPLKILRPTEKK